MDSTRTAAAIVALVVHLVAAGPLADNQSMMRRSVVTPGLS